MAGRSFTDVEHAVKIQIERNRALLHCSSMAPEKSDTAKVIRMSPGRAQDARDAIVSLEEMGDDELMMLARGGAHRAFDCLVRRHQERVLAVAGKFLARPDLARDMAQNTFLQVYSYRQRYLPRGRFRPFLYKVLLNQCRMAGRAAARDKNLALDRTLPGPDDLPEDRLLLRERMVEVERALAGLGKKLRYVLMLRYAGEMTHQEIAETLGLPVGTVKSRLFSGMEKLRKALEGGLP